MKNKRRAKSASREITTFDDCWNVMLKNNGKYNGEVIRNVRKKFARNIYMYFYSLVKSVINLIENYTYVQKPGI